MVLDKSMAEDVALREISRISSSIGIRCSLLREETRNLKDGWLFYYQSTQFLQTGSVSDRLAGNGPIFVGLDGNVRLLTSIPQ